MQSFTWSSENDTSSISTEILKNHIFGSLQKLLQYDKLGRFDNLCRRIISGNSPRTYFIIFS